MKSVARCYKKGYSYAAAVRALDRTQNFSLQSRRLRIYKCDRCGRWHLTSQAAA